jgi:hypothetical protein
MRLTTRLFLLISFLIALTVGTAVAVTLVLSARIGRQTITERLVKGDSLRAAQQEDLHDRLKLLANVFVADANLIAWNSTFIVALSRPPAEAITPAPT